MSPLATRPRRAADPALLGAVRATVARHRLLQRGDRVLIGVSGGPDSVALLHVLTRLRASRDLVLHAVHVDHQLRPESAQDGAWVRTVGASLRVPVTVEARDVRTACAANGWSLEDGARRLRYETLLDVARRYSLTRIALAHTADDQAETVLMRLLRGTGLTGLAGMPVARPLDDRTVIRPFLDVSRDDVMAYLAAEGLEARTDPSNDDGRFLRNRLRHELLPLLTRAYNPRITAGLVQLGRLSREDAEVLEGAARRHWRRVAARQADGAVALRTEPLRRLPEALQRHLVRLAIREVKGSLATIEYRHWTELQPLLAAGARPGTVDLPEGLRVRRRGARLVVERVGR